jgi:hypothetical protein
MNFSDMQARLNTAILRSDLQPQYGEFINEALVEIQNLRPWTFMKVTEQVALSPGDGFELSPLVSNFKELRRDPAINYIADDGGLIPATTVFAEQEIWRVWAWGGAPVFIWPPRVFLIRGPATPEQLATGQTIQASVGIIEPLIETFNLAVNIFAYLPQLVNGTDLSPFITAYPNMVLEKAKEIAFSAINDPQANFAAAEFERKYLKAAYQDEYSEVAGRKLRM